MDLFAQFDGQGAQGSDLGRVEAAMEEMRGKVPTDQKLAALAELGGRLTSPRLVHLLLAEEAPVQVAAMRRARLADAQWPALIAVAGPLARSVLRRRDDLGAEARRALDAFGLVDLSLIDLGREERVQLVAPVETPTVAPVEKPVAPAIEQSQIRRIVDRIERFTSERQERGARAHDDDNGETTAAEPAVGPVDAPEPVTQFSFTTDADGAIRSVVGVPRAALVGFGFASPSLDRSIGPDGQILGAFQRRGAFREGRLTLGEGALGGCWLIDGDPLFDQRTGRFTGYRATASRAQGHAIAPFMAIPVTAPPPSMGEAISLRELIHELRTPLSGVMGFAELIESQLLGPVSDRYRTMAGDIVTDVRKLVDILDDLDIANRADRQTAPVPPRGADVATLLAETIGQIGPDGEGRPRIRLNTVETAPSIDVAPAIAERMIVHLVRALVGCVGTETLAAHYREEGEALRIEIERPLAMADLSEAQLFDSGFEHVAENMDAPILGVGFTLRLVRRLAQANRGAFSVEPGHFVLTLPVPAQECEQGLTS